MSNVITLVRCEAQTKAPRLVRYDGPFLIGAVDIYDYQRETGFVRWNTAQAALAEAIERMVTGHGDLQETQS